MLYCIEIILILVKAHTQKRKLNCFFKVVAGLSTFFWNLKFLKHFCIRTLGLWHYSFTSMKIVHVQHLNKQKLKTLIFFYAWAFTRIEIISVIKIACLVLKFCQSKIVTFDLQFCKRRKYTTQLGWGFYPRVWYPKLPKITSPFGYPTRKYPYNSETNPTQPIPVDFFG